MTVSTTAATIRCAEIIYNDPDKRRIAKEVRVYLSSNAYRFNSAKVKMEWNDLAHWAMSNCSAELLQKGGVYERGLLMCLAEHFRDQEFRNGVFGNNNSRSLDRKGF